MTDFAELGFRAFVIPPDFAYVLRDLCDEQYRRPFTSDDCIAGYSRTELNIATIARLNMDNQYYGPVDAHVAAVLVEYLETIAADVERELGYPWKIGNVRAWKVIKPDEFGPTSWHTDELPPQAIKMMLYLQPMSVNSGTLELVDRKGDRHHLMTQYPACVLFDNNALRHRGISGRGGRMTIEVLTLPAEKTTISYLYAGQNARVPDEA